VDQHEYQGEGRGKRGGKTGYHAPPTMTHAGKNLSHHYHQNNKRCGFPPHASMFNTWATLVVLLFYPSPPYLFQF